MTPAEEEEEEVEEVVVGADEPLPEDEFVDEVILNGFCVFLEKDKKF